MSNLNEEEPIHWAVRGGLGREKAIRKDGKRSMIKYPQTARNSLGVKRRWELMVDGAGNTVRAVLTNASADLNTSGPYAQRMRAKWKAFGWFPVARCPLALVAVDELHTDFIDESIIDDKACKPGTYSESRPCEHTLAEIKSRRAAHKADMDERMPKYKDLAEQMADQNAVQVEQNQELVNGIAGAFTEALKQAKEPVKEEPVREESK